MNCGICTLWNKSYFCEFVRRFSASFGVGLGASIIKFVYVLVKFQAYVQYEYVSMFVGTYIYIYILVYLRMSETI